MSEQNTPTLSDETRKRIEQDAKSWVRAHIKEFPKYSHMYSLNIAAIYIAGATAERERLQKENPEHP